jgi:hypothetical protein
VAGAYLAIALYALRVLLPHFAEVFPEVPGRGTNAIVFRADQQLTAWAVTRNARTLLTEPWHLFDWEQCYPAERAGAFGHLLLSEGLLGLAPYWLGADPIVAYNAMLVLSLVLPALAMWALVYHWTGRVGPAFVAGLLFAFHPQRILATENVFAHSNIGMPLALLFADRLFRGRRWRDAVGLGLAIGLQVVESIYQTLALAILGGVYGLYLVWRHAREVPRLLPKLLLVVAILAAVALVLIPPYVHARAAWGILGGRMAWLLFWGQLAPGQFAYPGTVAVVLAGLAIVDRVRRRPGDPSDPRLPYLAAGLVLLCFTVWGIFLPGGGLIPFPMALLGRYVGPIGGGRVLFSMVFSVFLVVAFLAGFGLHVLTRRYSAPALAAVTLVVVALALGEIFAPALSRRTFGTTAELGAYTVRPEPAALAIYDATPRAPLIDLPDGLFHDMENLFRSAFHGRPVAACYRAFPVPVTAEVRKLTARLPEDSAADALHALGFRSVVAHGDKAGGGIQVKRLAALGGTSRLTEIGRTGAHVAYRLDSPVPAVASFAPLTAGATAVREPASVRPPSAVVVFTFQNASRAVYRHPRPIEPSDLVVRWQPVGGGPATSHAARLLLPLTLVSGEATTRELNLVVPPERGDYDVTLATAGTGEVLSERRVRVE